MKLCSFPSIRVAVVDDDEHKELITADLGSRGYSVQGFSTAEALYRHLSVHRVDIVVLDVGLPGESGFSAAAHLRQLASVGIIMLTGHTSAKAMQRGFSEGADIYLTKPVDYDVLGAAVANLHRRLVEFAPAPSPVPSRSRTPSMQWTLADGGWTLRGPEAAALSLSDQERVLLSLLFEKLGETVLRTRLMAALSEQPQDFDPHRLDALVYRLRNRVRSVCGQDLPLRSVRGTGYVLTA
ncbi:response regulator transcription factor [Stenotrophomonas maltophilia]|uniref:response regulator transcription factor n=1 Tax=Stenotrophomonas maltophilia TaxID=40324 RepID=UPI001F533CA9|nr:response regulator transcription factor [Stenotrophomonas maltophilia]MCI1058800.1 response regulator transcription factor [Stenotrophomonas maltophilia]MCI1062267.1 response regulator transcription factor [Stenotrophomonas maltophilia]MCI1079770.1 response regulator transcription factor [Stenotrophomonas maltophilia]MCI1082919.1 response regulator transcription factor [Stenotrophomonas maltophilia]MCI1095242.1 response regulator transcription factor [Stenotrophomonas maltophilia]